MFKIFGWLKSKLFRIPRRQLSSIEYIASVIEEGVPNKQENLVDFYEVICDYISCLSKEHKNDVIDLIMRVRESDQDQVYGSNDKELVVKFSNGDEAIILSKIDRMINASMLFPR